MKQMQEEIIAKARWDGGYPKAIIVGIGFVRLVRSPEEEREAYRVDRWCWIIGIVGGIALGTALFWLLP